MIRLRRAPRPSVLAPPAETRRREATIAKARSIVATLSLVAIYLDPTEPNRYARLAYGLLAAYVAYSLLAAVRLADAPRSSRKGRVLVHVVDIAWVAVISLFTDGPNSPFFLFFFFILVAAAYRWGSRATLLTAGVAVVILAGEAALLVGLTSSPRWNLFEEPIDLNRLLMRAVYFLIAGYLLGYLADSEKRYEHEASAIAGLLVRVRAESGIRGTIQVVFDDLSDLFDTPRVLLVLRETASGRSWIWSRGRGGSEEGAPEMAEIDEGRRDTYLFPVAGAAWRSTRPGSDRPRDALVLDSRGERLASPPVTPPPELLAAHPCSAILAVSFALGKEWSGRLFLFDSARHGENDLRFLQRMVHHVAPAIENVFLVRRLRTRAGAIERARVARELHDGVIQSLIGLEMQVDVLRRQAVQKRYGTAGSLTEIQALLRNEVLAVRELMEQMKPVDVGPGEILDHLAALVDKFQRETGISARFTSQLSEVTLSPRVCREISRIVQEALVNIRRHSGARQAVVRFGREKDKWTLVIDDDGRGFAFSGRLSQAELDTARQGPVVILERVRSAGGELAIESNPGRGSRLEIWLPVGAAHA